MGNAINGILGIIVVPLSVAYLGPAKYGLFSIYSVLAIYVTLLDLGVTKDLTRLLAGEKEVAQQVQYLRTALGFYIGVSLLLLLLLPLAFWLVPQFIFPVPIEFLTSLKWIIFLSLLEYFIGIPSAMLRSYGIAQQQFAQYARFNVITGVYKYLFQLLAVVLFASPTVAVAIVVSRKLIDIISARWLMPALPDGAWIPSFNLQRLFSTIRTTSLLSLAQLFQSTVLMIGSVLVNRNFGIVNLGLYRAAFDLANRIWFFSNGLGAVIFPKFASDLSEPVKRRQLLNKLPKFLQISWVAYMGIAIIGILAAPTVLWIMHLTQPGVLALFTLLLIGLCMNAHSNLSYEFIQATGKYQQVLTVTLLSLLLMIGNFVWLKNSLGIYAIGWAWIISQSFFAIVTDALTLNHAQFLLKGQAGVIARKLLFLLPALMTMLPIALMWKITAAILVLIYILQRVILLRATSL